MPDAVERQLTFAPHGHILTNVGVWSPDGRSIVYDIRSDPAGSVFDGTRIESVDVATGKITVLYESRKGASCGIASYSAVEAKVAFILGPENPTPDWQYSANHRQGRRCWYGSSGQRNESRCARSVFAFHSRRIARRNARPHLQRRRQVDQLHLSGSSVGAVQTANARLRHRSSERRRQYSDSRESFCGIIRINHRWRMHFLGARHANYGQSETRLGRNLTRGG